MKKSITNYARIGTVLHMAYPEVMSNANTTIECLNKIAKDHFFEVIEIVSMPADIRVQARKIIETSGMTASYGAQVPIFTQKLNLNSLDEQERTKAVEVMKSQIDEAYEMNTEDFTFVCGPYEPGSEDAALRVLIRSTSEMCEYAKQKGGMRIVHEMFDYDVDKKVLVGPAHMAKKYADAMSNIYDNFGLLVDLSHLPLIRENPAEAIIPVKEYITHAHMGNNIYSHGDQHPRIGYPGSANNTPELAVFLQTLLDVGYLNERNPPMLCFEVKPKPDEDPDLVVANCKRQLGRAWKLVTRKDRADKK